MARLIKADDTRNLAHQVRPLGPRARPSVAIRRRPQTRVHLRPDEEKHRNAEAWPESSGRTDETKSFVALHGPEGVEAADLAARQLPPAPDEEEAAQMERAEYAREAERLRRLVQRIVERVLSERQNMVHAARAQIVELAMAIAERVVRQAVSCDPAAAERAVTEALTHVHSSERVRVRLNPSDLDHVRNVDLETAAGFTGIERLQLIEDADVDVGGCVVETEMGAIDGRIATQLAQVEHTLLEALRTGRVDAPGESAL